MGINMLNKVIFCAIVSFFANQTHAWNWKPQPYSGNFNYKAFSLYAALYGLAKVEETASQDAAFNLPPAAEFDKLPEAPPVIKDSAHELAKKVGVDPEHLKIVYSKRNHTVLSPAASLGNKYLVIYDSFFKLPDDQQKGALAHELVHIKYNDGYHRIYSMIKIPMKIIAGTHLIAHGVHKLGNFLEPRSKTPEQLQRARNLQSTAGLFTYVPYQLLLTCGWGQIWYGKKARAQEKRADIEAAQLTGTGQGLINWLKDLRLAHGDYPWYTRLGAEHPTFSTRIAYLEKEAATLSNANVSTDEPLHKGK